MPRSAAFIFSIGEKFGLERRSVEFSPVAVPRLSLQEQATPLHKGLMAPQLSSLRTSFERVTRTEIKESVIYRGRLQGFDKYGAEGRHEIERNR
jgi:hypothetical protein